MGSGGTEWENSDLISHERLNQKTVHVGATEPPTMYAGMIWFDTANGLLKFRNADNDAWYDYFNQAVKTTSSPTFAGLTLTSFSGFVKATAGVLSAAALADSDIPDTITLSNITQITNRSHTSLTDIGTITHATIDTYLNQAVKTTSGPTFDHLHTTAGIEVGSAIVSDTQDTDDLGSTTKEWRNIYIGDAGKLYFGLGQDVSLYRGAADTLRLTDGDFFEIGDGSFDTKAYALFGVTRPISADNLSYIGLTKVGTIPWGIGVLGGGSSLIMGTAANTKIITTPIFTLSSAGALILASSLTVGADIVSDTADTDSLGSTSKEWRNLYIGDAGKIYLGLSQDVNLYRSAANTLKTDDALTIIGTTTIGLLKVTDDTYDVGIPTGGSFGSIWNQDMYMDYLQFNPPTTQEYYDGSTWTSETVNGDLFIGMNNGGTLTVHNADVAYRWTWTTFPYCYLDCFYSYINSNANTFTVVVETSPDGSTWTERINRSGISGWSGAFNYKKSFNTNGLSYLRITFTPVRVNANDMTIHSIRFFGNYPSYNTKLYTWDSSRNITFYGGLIVGSNIVSDTADTDDLGSTSKEWKNIYLGDAGKLYLGLGQDVALNRSGANTLTIAASSGVSFNGNITFTSTQTVDGRDISADLDQAVKTTSSPTFAGLTLTAFSGFVKATAGVLSAAALADSDIPDTITLTNITQITNRSHTSLSDIGTLTHATIDTYLNQAVKTTSSPTFSSLTLSSSLTVTSAIIPDAADTCNLGSTSKEWKDIYLGETGGINFGLSQDVNLYRGGANQLKTDDAFYAVGNITTDGTVDGIDIAGSLNQAVKTTSSPTFANVHLGTGKLYLGGSDEHYVTYLSATEIVTDRDFSVGGDALVGTPAAHNTNIGLLASAGGGAYYSGSITVNGTSGLMSITSTHSLLLNVTGTVQTACDLTSDTADTDSLGSTTKEWKNIYVGDAGRIYLGLGQDTSIYRSGANALGIIASSGVTLSAGLTVGSAIVSDTADTDDLGSTSKEWKNLYIGTGKIYLGTGQDVNLYRSDANILKTDDSFYIGSGVLKLNYAGLNSIELNDGTKVSYIGMAHATNDLVTGSGQGDIVYRTQSRNHVFSIDNGTSILGYFGGNGVNALQVTSYGSISGHIFKDRTSSREWQWYGTGDVAYLHNGSANILTIKNNGDLTSPAAIRATYFTDALSPTKTNLQTSATDTALAHNSYMDGSWHNIDATTKASVLILSDIGTFSYYCTDTAGGVDFVQKFYVAADGNCWIQSNCSADSYTERSSFYEGDALTELKKITGKDGKLDHNSLPTFVKRTVKKQSINFTSNKTEEEEVIEKDLGATISMLTTAVIQLSKEIDEIKLKLKMN